MLGWLRFTVTANIFVDIIICVLRTNIYMNYCQSFLHLCPPSASSIKMIYFSLHSTICYTHTPSRNCQKYTSLHLFHPHSGGVPEYSRVVGGILCDWWLFQDTCLHHPPTHWLWAPWHMSRNFSLCFTCVMIMIITGIYSDVDSILEFWLINELMTK